MEPQWERLGREVLEHRTRRGWSQAKVTKRGGPSDTLQTKIESGKWRPTRGVDETLKKIDAGLGWLPGSASRVLAGGKPSFRLTDDDLRSPLAPGQTAGQDAIEKALADADERSTGSDVDVPPESRGGMLGVRAARRRKELLEKPSNERTPEETEWLAAYDEAHPRRLDPRIFPSGEYRSPEVIFDDWLAARNRMLNVTLEYAATRKIPFQVAEEELAHIQQMAADVQSGTGRPWTPPWNPGAEFLEGEEPWKREWWSIVDQNIGGVSTIGWAWDIKKVRQNRSGDAQRKAEWEAHRQVELERYYSEQAAARDAGQSRGRQLREEQDRAAEGTDGDEDAGG